MMMTQLQSTICVVLQSIMNSLDRAVTSPITLGLAILIHHEFGSKTLVNRLSAIGHCVSFTELRHFLTSVAAGQISRTERGVYIPTGLTGVT